MSKDHRKPEAESAILWSLLWNAKHHKRAQPDFLPRMTSAADSTVKWAKVWQALPKEPTVTLWWDSRGILTGLLWKCPILSDIVKTGKRKSKDI